jgi:hypothetical protein
MKFEIEFGDFIYLLMSSKLNKIEKSRIARRYLSEELLEDFKKNVNDL